MPLAFPSHQGLILPLWRRFPAAIDGVALCVGAAMPDVIDGTAGLFRGRLGQWMGHSLIGILVAVPYGLAITWVVRRLLPRAWIARLDQGAPESPGIARAGVSIAIGALSHLATDLVTHSRFVLLWPWYVNDHAFPSWWETKWESIPLPGYPEPYPIAPHTLSWVLLSAVGVWLFVRCWTAGFSRPPAGGAGL